MGAKPQGVWGTGVSQHGPGTEPTVSGLGHEVPQKLKHYKVSYKQILRDF